MGSQIGQKIGVYTILRLLGSGGMGEVWYAERSDGRYQQQVAIKLMQSFRQTPDGIYRFARERQILASLQHPGIARLLDGGITDNGQLYYAMEYVDGISINRYCSENSLTVSQKLNLFEKACAAARYAHRKLIIHSDLKPEHILINDAGDVKLLDFGLAHLQEKQRAETLAKPLFTPAYASPEQISGELLTTSTDVYSLGIILYELLTDRHPFDLAGKTDLEVLKAVSSEQPQNPSFLNRNITTELNQICLKALEKKPEDRYPSVEAFVDDLKRYQSGLPITARSASRSYRLGKFLRRNIIASVCSALAIVAVLFTMGFYTLKLQQERASAIDGQQRAESLNNFLQQLFESSDRRGDYGADPTAKQLVDQGAQRIEVELRDEPEALAMLMRTIGRVYYRLGFQKLEEEFQQKSMALSLREFSDSSLELIESRRAYAEALSHAGKNAEADSQLTIALQVASNNSREEYSFQQHSAVVNDLAVIKRRQKKFSDAIPLLEEALRMGEEVGDTVQTLTSMFNLGTTYRRTGKMAEAKEILIRLIPLVDAHFGEDHPHMASSLSSLGIVYRRLGQPDMAIEQLGKSLKLREKIYGESHPKLRSVLNNLASLLAEKDQMGQAIGLRRRSIAIGYQFYGKEHRYVLDNLHTIAYELIDEERFEEAEEALNELAETIREAFGEDHLRMAQQKEASGYLYHKKRMPDEAEVSYRQAVQITRRVTPDGDDKRFDFLYSLADFLREQRRYVEAEPFFLECLKLAMDNPERLAKRKTDLLNDMIQLYEKSSRPTEVKKFQAILAELEAR